MDSPIKEILEIHISYFKQSHQDLCSRLEKIEFSLSELKEMKTDLHLLTNKINNLDKKVNAHISSHTENIIQDLIKYLQTDQAAILIEKIVHSEELEEKLKDFAERLVDKNNTKKVNKFTSDSNKLVLKIISGVLLAATLLFLGIKK